ncbi:MAG: regulatory protein RecX [Candidatus Andersenbacteria bacterium]|nr:regulatory protein RecX [Candidatus Andersenbacteria bacterium]
MPRQGQRTNPYYQAQAILARRDHSVAELAAKLRRQGFSAGQVTDTLGRLQQNSLLDDERFTSAYIAAALRRTSVGPIWLRHKLRQKGIQPNYIVAVLQRTFPPGRERSIARQAAAAWRRLHPSHQNDWHRLTRFLLSRGFSSDVISALRTDAN